MPDDEIELLGHELNDMTRNILFQFTFLDNFYILISISISIDNKW